MTTNDVILATAGYDHTIRFWEAPSGICYRTVQYPDSQINCLKITPDKKYLTAAGNPHIRLFEIHSNNPNPVTSYDGHTGNVTSLGFQRHGKWMYTASEDGTIKIWDLRARGCQRSYDCNAPVNCVALHPNQVELICGDQNGNVRVWDLVANACSTKMVPEGECGVRSVDFAQDGSVAIAGNSNGNCFLWQPKSSSSYESVGNFSAHKEYLLKCLISNDCRYLATSSSDQTAKIWDMKTHQLLKTLQTPQQKWVWDCQFSADSSYLLTASSDGYARLWDLSNGDVVKQYSGHQKAIVCVALNDTPSEG